MRGDGNPNAGRRFALRCGTRNRFGACLATPTAPSPFASLFRVVPAIGSLRDYDASDARADFVAGITVAAVAVPQAMAYAMVAGLPAEYGL